MWAPTFRLRLSGVKGQPLRSENREGELESSTLEVHTVHKSATSAEQSGTLRVLGKSLCQSVRLPFSVSAPRLTVFQFIPCDKSPCSPSDKR